MERNEKSYLSEQVTKAVASLRCFPDPKCQYVPLSGNVKGVLMEFDGRSQQDTK
jgi:hypothetical protein